MVVSYHCSLVGCNNVQNGFGDGRGERRNLDEGMHLFSKHIECCSFPFLMSIHPRVVAYEVFIHRLGYRRGGLGKARAKGDLIFIHRLSTWWTFNAHLFL
jgi:hypothetical protein